MKKIEVNREVFSDAVIEKALFDYRAIAKTSLKKKDRYAIITFWFCKYDENQTTKEFENYLIGLENS